MLGLRVLYPGIRFDLVISGINRGDNLGLHVVYSGTVAGAREGAMRVDAVIAISLCSYSRSADYAAAAECAAELAAEIADAPALARALRGRVLTVNVPAVPRRDIRGIQLTRPGVSCTQCDWVRVAGEGCARRHRRRRRLPRRGFRVANPSGRRPGRGREVGQGETLVSEQTGARAGRSTGGIR